MTAPPRALEVSGLVEPGPALAVQGLLDPLADGMDVTATVPAMWHVAYLLPEWRQRDLGPDGHPAEGVPAPPGPGMRRMFAGGRTTHHRLLRMGSPARRTSRVISSTVRHGRSGDMTIVTVRHEIEQGGFTCIAEEQDIVYLADAPAGSKPAPDDDGAEPESAVEFEVDTVVLFRFSAATRNTHRIHYDRAYAAQEGYPDLVVHGPLQILLLASALEGLAGPLVGHTFHYRLVAPAVGPQVLAIESGTAPAPWAGVRSASGTVTARGWLEAAS